MKTKIKNRWLLIALMATLIAVCGAAMLFIAKPTEVHAASNTGIQNFQSTETISHVYAGSSGLGNPIETPTSYTESIIGSTGIKIYGAINNGTSSMTSGIQVDCTTIYVDFSAANSLYYARTDYSISDYYDNTYRFEILLGSTVKWYATYTGSTYQEVTGQDADGNDITATRYKKVININGKSTTTTSESSSLRRFNPRDFGTNLINLPDGNYTIRITRSYYWKEYVKGSGFLNYRYYKFNSSSTRTGYLKVDTTNPTMTMRGYSNGATIANGATVNQRVTFTTSDANPYYIYYKTPTSSGYTATTASSYTSSTTNGWYYVYAKDSTGHESPVYSFYYDSYVPTGTITANGSTVSSGSTISKSFAYNATDSGSGIRAVYYRTPQSSSYQPYTSGTIIPTSAGDGWYYFYSVDNAGNTSSTLSVCLDTTKPALTMRCYSSGNTITSGSSVGERVTISASDTHFSQLYYKVPGSSSYSSTTASSYTCGTTNGWYYVYAVDSVGNVSDTYSFLYDSVAPTGTIYCNGSSVASGAYVSKNFSYSATDSGSGVKTIYYKTPVSGVYQQYASGTIIPSNAGDGWYYFYAVDAVGNVSATKSVYLETQAPLVTIYRNGTVAYSKNMLTTSESFDTDIYLKPNDTLKITCDTSSGNATCNYALNTNITIGSSYTGSNYTITVTSATGITNNFTYHIVRNKPSFTIGGQRYYDGSVLYLNSDVEAGCACDSVIIDPKTTGVSISSEGYYNVNEFHTYKDGTARMLSTAEGTVTKYILTANDRAGNTSSITVFVDKLAPAGTWNSNGRTISNNGYTNKPLSFTFSESGVTAIYSYNGGEYQSYTSGQTFSADGTYKVVLTDLAQNKSYFTAYIDTVVPTGQLYADFNPVEDEVVTNKPIFFTWDGDITATCNGNPYVKNTRLTEDAVYRFVLTDFAGNATVYTATIDTEAPIYNQDKLHDSTLLKSKWYLVTDEEEKYSFASYSEALSFASSKEYASHVTELTLDDVLDFTQHHLVADNGSAENTDDEVRVGTYWLYKSKANPDSLLYYFDRNLLDEAIAFYAKDFVSPLIYLVNEGENEFGIASESMSDNVMLALDGTRAPSLNGFVFDKVDGVKLFAELVGGTRRQLEYGVPFDSQITAGGLYKLIEVDEAGNETVFYGFLDTQSPELRVSATIFGNEDARELIISKAGLNGIAAYYYESFNINDIVDADSWAVLTVEKDGAKAFYSNGDTLPYLTEGGEYLLSLYDRFGNGYSFTVFIVGNPASIEFENNEDDTAFDVSITLEQKFDTLVSIEIRRNGIALDNITASKLDYTFDKEGVYTIILRDNFGRIIEKEYNFVKAKPVGELLGVENGGKTKTDVGFTYDSDKYYVSVTKDGQTIMTVNNGEVQFKASDAASGNYLLKLIRKTDDENFTEYRFTINTLSPVFDMSVGDGMTTNKDVVVSWTQTDIVSVTYSLNGGEEVALNNGGSVSAEGTYTVTATNDLGTVNVKTFTIDKTLDYVVTIGAVPITGVDVTNDTVSVIANENLQVTVTKDGEPFSYEFGDVITEEGVYSFHVSDEYSNAVTFFVTIDKTVNYRGTVGDGMISNGGVTFANGEYLTITVMKNNTVIDYTFGQRLDDEGTYKVFMKDSYGNEKVLNFQIVKGVKAKLDYKLGDNVQVVKVELDGQEIVHNGNDLKFTKDGEYTITAVSEGETYTFKLTLDSTAPDVTLTGCEDGKTTNGNVSVSWTDTDVKSVVCKFNGGEAEVIENGAEFTAEGAYEIIAQDILDNTVTLSFTIDKTLEFEIEVDGEKADSVEKTNKDVVILNNEALHVSVVKDGEAVAYTFGQAISEEGQYAVRIYDDFGNEAELSFCIDKTAPTVVLNGVEDGGVGHKYVTITEMSEDGTIEVYKNGEKIEYELGDKLEDYANYEVHVKDDLGNERTYSFTLEYKMPGIFIALIVVGGVAVLGVGVFFILKKKKIIK